MGLAAAGPALKEGTVRNILYEYLSDLQHRQRITIALQRGMAARGCRMVDLSLPQSWEFSGFSQNGEDGIIEVLRQQLREQNRYFVEIGAADGMQNNTSWLLVAQQYSGLMIEGDKRLAARARRLLPGYGIGTEVRHAFVTRENAVEISRGSPCADPDVFSLDIDGNDYHICRVMLEAGFRPKICAVEYNSAYGADRRLTIKYQEDFNFLRAHPTQLYYGVSLNAWRQLFATHGYRFVTVERNGVNAFFVDPVHFDGQFLDNVHPLEFAGNRYQDAKFRLSHDAQFELIANEEFMEL